MVFAHFENIKFSVAKANGKSEINTKRKTNLENAVMIKQIHFSGLDKAFRSSKESNHRLNPSIPGNASQALEQKFVHWADGLNQIVLWSRHEMTHEL